MTMYRQMKTSLFGAGAAMILLTAPGSAVAETKPAIEYYLTKTEVAVGLKLTLAGCPQKANDLPLIRQEWLVEAEGVADPAHLIRVDISKGFLVERSVGFTFNPNGTLAAFNAKAEGQGGKVLESVIKTAGAVIWAASGVGSQATMMADPPPGTPPPQFVCTEAVIQQLDQVDRLGLQIRQLEDRLALAALTAAETQLLDRLRDARARTVKTLTMVIEAPLTNQDSSRSWKGEVKIYPKIAKWFEPSSGLGNRVGFNLGRLEGIKGYSVEISPKDTAAKPHTGPKPDTAAIKDPARLLYYRRPVMAKVAVEDIACGATCTKTLTTEAPLMIGQWGKIEMLKIGAGSIFGSREAKAKFDEFGTPLELSYGSDSGGEGIASAIGTAGQSAISVADADIVALEKAIKRAELRKQLDELNAE